MNLADQPVFPVPGHVTGDHDRNGDPIVVGAAEGMTYRQWLIGMALQGFCAFPGKSSPEDAVKLAVAYADAAIRAQEK